MKKNFFKATLAVVAIATVGMGSYKAYGAYVAANMSESELLFTENVNALADGDAGTNCPGPDYVPDHYIEAACTSATGTCNVDGQLSVGTNSSSGSSATVSGNFKKGKTYTVAIEVKNCTGVQQGACCDQRKVGVSIKK